MTKEINAVGLAAEVTAAWLANASTRTNAADVSEFLRLMHICISQLGITTVPEPADKPSSINKPAVSVRESLADPDHIISLINGQPFKILQRHLAMHGLSPSEYRLRYKLAADYPMVAPSYSETRRIMAKSIGLGRKAQKAVEKIPDVPPKAARKPRARKAPKSV